MQSEEWKAGLEAEKAGIKWWDNPHPSGSVASYEWDNGHTAARTRRARGGYLVSVLPASAWYDHGQLNGGGWDDLPVASFAESGTNVPTGLYTISKGK